MAPEPATIEFSQGWTVEIVGQSHDFPHIYLQWIATGSMDAQLPDLTVWEARAFAQALLDAADRVGAKQ